MPRHSDSVIAIIQIGADRWLRFTDPVCVFRADDAAGVPAVIADVERMTREPGLHAVGFLGFEAGAAFGLATHAPRPGVPVAWFALFEPKKALEFEGSALPAGDHAVGRLAPSMDRTQFEAAFARVRQHVADGDSYQVNLTFKLTGDFSGDPLGLFRDLTSAQQGRYSVYAATAEWAVCSASPECFFQFEGLTIRTRPMKGTAPRGRTIEEDERRRNDLQASAKQQAENVMIVDMMRNDLGRVAETGSVQVEELFAVERYPTLWQMTSTVTARSMASLGEVFAALHPSASVTGAPKVRTMEILAELEPGPRGVYTGAVGHVPPDGNAVFNVAIRTAVVDRINGRVEFGVGSGIVWDSEAATEYDECLLKARILTAGPADFDLLETLRWQPDGGFLLLERHLDRIQRSAVYFGVRCDVAAMRQALAAAVDGRSVPQRVRLLVDRYGTVRCERADLATSVEPLKIGLARDPVDTADVFLFHKTTRRGVYDRARATAPALDDVVLWNDRGEITESTAANVVVRGADGRRVTPPVACGLLAGTFRAELLARGDIHEAIVTREDLRAAAEIWLINSVHEWRTATLAE